MRSLSPTLLAEQKAASSLPHLKVEADESLPDVAHPLFSRLYTGVEPAWRHAAHMPGDG
jgi:hypothetical protein